MPARSSAVVEQITSHLSDIVVIKLFGLQVGIAGGERADATGERGLDVAQPEGHGLERQAGGLVRVGGGVVDPERALRQGFLYIFEHAISICKR